MKKIKLFLILFSLNTLLFNLHAQSLQIQADGKDLANDTIAKLTSFSGKYNTGKVYLKWTVLDQRTDGLYLIYRSADGIKFENIGVKAGVGVPISKDIAYFFSDNAPIAGKTQYKIVHLGSNNTFLNSEAIVVASDNIELVSK